jgi:exosome complex component RRP4
MVALIREFTNVRMFVGQNGRIWIDGDPEGVHHAAYVIRLIDESGPMPGLTDAIRVYLEAAYGRRATTPAERDDDGRH